MAQLPFTVQACADFLQHESVLALIQYVYVLVIVSCSTGMCFTVLVMISHSTCLGMCAGSFSQYVRVLIMVSQYRCVLAFFTVRVYTGYVLPQHMCALTVLQYVCVLDMVFHSTYVC